MTIDMIACVRQHDIQNRSVSCCSAVEILKDGHSMIDDGILIVQSFVRSFDIFQGYTNQQPSSFFKYF
jgi:hypothetical protein